MPWTEHLTVVLHQVRSPENLGSTARAMANFGLKQLILSEPRTFAFSDAERVAIRGERLLESMRIAPNLKEALGECTYACGTTSREQIDGRATLEPEEAIARLREACLRGRGALVFGGEKRGLSNSELALCHDIARIATHVEQPSMNLSHSVAVLAYLASRHAAASNEAALPIDGSDAPLELLFSLEERMKRALARVDFLNPQAPDHVVAELRQTLLRARLSRRETELWLTAFKQLERALGRTS